METTNLITYLFCYAVLFVLSRRNKINDHQRLVNDEGGFTTKPRGLITAHITGISWLVLAPVIMGKRPVLTALAGNEMPAVIPVLTYGLVWIVIITIAFKQSEVVFSRKQVNPQELLQLPRTFFISYFISRALFLFVYELWFRGFLLFDSINWVGIPAAVSLNVLLYVLVHIFSSRKEMLSCIPFGILVCFLNISFSAVWPAIILHVSFSLLYELNIYRSCLSKFKTARL